MLNQNCHTRKAQLHLKGLRFPAYIGWYEEERESLQDIIVSVELVLKGVPNAVRTDTLEETLCYGSISERLTDRLEGKSFYLLENAAGAIEEELTAFSPLILSYRISVSKAKIPIKMPYESVQFILEGSVGHEE